ncbi:MAG: hypothetical protein MJD61_05200 [Proteobacteria bacterium]|nr:hypothetical protein [Pseudomonadota bacterium]
MHVEPAAGLEGQEACCRRLAAPDVLRVVLTVALDRAAAARCLGLSAEQAETLWSSSLYQLLALRASRSSIVWRRCARALDRWLERVRRQHGRSLSLERMLGEDRKLLSGTELAALLWALVRQQSPASDLLARRLGAELETLAERRLGELTDLRFVAARLPAMGRKIVTKRCLDNPMYRA